MARIYSQENRNIKVVVSGVQDPDEYVSESYAMKKYLTDNGIEEERIVLKI